MLGNIKLYLRTITLILSTFITLFTYAQDATSELESNYQQQVKTLTSKVLNEQRTFTVQLPRSYSAKTSNRYPVIYRLDGAENLPLMTEVLQRLHEANAAPEVIIVAIENTDRLRDFYHTANQDPRGPLGLGGGAAKFLEFIEDELIPLVNNQYRTHDFKVIAGASAAGAFALYALQTKPELFQAHITYSPAIWWDFGAAAKSTKAFISRTKTLNNFLYMNIGEESGFMRETYDDMSQFMLAHKPKGLTLITDSFDHVPHGLTSVAGIFNAYKNLFLPIWMPPRKYTGETNSITKYYRQLSTQYGEQFAPPEWVIRELGYSLVNNRDLESAITVFKFDISLYPESADPYNALAYGYEQNGQFKHALEQVNKALSLSKEGDDGYDVYLRRKERMIEQLKHEN